MPKTFTETEREYISERLISEAQKCLALYGIRKTTVDELIRRVNIPKGTFYLFYESKDRLFFDVILKFNDEVQADLFNEIASMSSAPNADELTDIILRFYRRLDDSFLPRLMQDGELEFFMRTLPPELSKLHAEHDASGIRNLLSAMPGMQPQRAEVFSAALRGVFMSILHKSEIGEEIFEDMLRVLIRGVVLQMTE
ncbi:MAG: TetR/AcrR family transcriptional regulator [Clostridiales bacterium]|nr:TetR/AcrR family transcriptional regulator [Clostridiales bacterium]